jgi:hypothetical protein
MAALRALRSPFREAPDSSVQVGRLEAVGRQVADWRAADGAAALAALVPALSGPDAADGLADGAAPKPGSPPLQPQQQPEQAGGPLAGGEVSSPVETAAAATAAPAPTPPSAVAAAAAAAAAAVAGLTLPGSSRETPAPGLEAEMATEAR